MILHTVEVDRGCDQLASGLEDRFGTPGPAQAIVGFGVSDLPVPLAQIPVISRRRVPHLIEPIADHHRAWHQATVVEGAWRTRVHDRVFCVLGPRGTVWRGGIADCIDHTIAALVPQPESRRIVDHTGAPHRVIVPLPLGAPGEHRVGRVHHPAHAVRRGRVADVVGMGKRSAFVLTVEVEVIGPVNHDHREGIPILVPRPGFRWTDHRSRWILHPLGLCRHDARDHQHHSHHHRTPIPPHVALLSLVCFSQDGVATEKSHDEKVRELCGVGRGHQAVIVSHPGNGPFRNGAPTGPRQGTRWFGATSRRVLSTASSSSWGRS